MKIYKCKAEKIKGTSFREVHKKACQFYDLIKGKTKRKPYIRSAYFGKEKIFLNLFWIHLQDKNSGDRRRRLPYLPLAIELIKNSKNQPEIKKNPNKPLEVLYCFKGLDRDDSIFFVQIKRSSSGRKWLMSTYPQ